jgi:hypothetical protein
MISNLFFNMFTISIVLFIMMLSLWCVYLLTQKCKNYFLASKTKEKQLEERQIHLKKVMNQVFLKKNNITLNC